MTSDRKKTQRQEKKIENTGKIENTETDIEKGREDRIKWQENMLKQQIEQTETERKIKRKIVIKQKTENDRKYTKR